MSLMNFTLKIWRQKSSESVGYFSIYKVKDISSDMSFLEMLDVLNESLICKGKRPIAFDSDCREGICGTCALVINGIPHGKEPASTVCQLHMRSFVNNQSITIEPWRAKAFPILSDLMVDRSSLDRIMQQGGFISVNAGMAPDANTISIAKQKADESFDAAACIGCGACVAVCKNASAMLFLSAKIVHLIKLPQGKHENSMRIKKMLNKMDTEGFGSCSNTLACEAICPKEISVQNIAILNFQYLYNS